MAKATQLLLFLFSLGLMACQEKVVQVVSIPENTPKESRLYLAGNFNYWDPTDPSFELLPDAEGNYYTKLPIGWGTINYKVTRGDWSTVEANACGYYISNRILDYFGTDTVRIGVESWDDLVPVSCDRVTIKLKPPINTKLNDKIYVAGTFNNWEFTEQTLLKPTKDGKFQITLNKTHPTIEFKFSKGNSWDFEELNSLGNTVNNHKFTFGKTDTVNIEVPLWKNLANINPNYVVINVKVPKNTKPEESVYIAGNFNNWKTNDAKYKLKPVSNGIYETVMPRKFATNLTFKFCKGSWEKGEVDELGKILSDRSLSVGVTDSVFLEIKGWRDSRIEPQ